MTITIDQYLDDVIASIDRKSTVLPDRVAALRRNILHYLWLVTYEPNTIYATDPWVKLPLTDLLPFLGASRRNVVEKIIELELDAWIKLQDGAIRIRRSDLTRIQKVLDNHYGVTENIPFINMKGYEFIGGMYNRPHMDGLFNRVLDALRLAFNVQRQNPNVETVIVHPNIARIHATNEDWYFMLGLFTNDNSVDFKAPHETWDTMRIVSELVLACYHQQTSLERLEDVFNTLVILPDTASYDAYNHLVACPYIYRVTPLGVLKLLRGIQKLLDSGFDKIELSLRLDNMFPKQTMWHFGVESALRILAGLESGIEAEEGFIVPICVNSKATSTPQVNLQFGYNPRTGHLMPDPDFRDTSPHIHSLSFAGRRYAYRIIHIELGDGTDNRPSEFAYLTLDELTGSMGNGKLNFTDAEIQIIRTAAIVVQSGGD